MRRRCWASAALLHGLDKAMCARCWRVWLNGLARDVNLPKLAALQAQLRSSGAGHCDGDFNSLILEHGRLYLARYQAWRTPPGHATRQRAVDLL
jgi:hypothetical protein